MKSPVRVTVTGPAGQIGYSILFRIASGEMLGADQPIILTLLERKNSQSKTALEGVKMELADCAFPLLVEMISTSDPLEAFKDADYALLIGSRPRGPGMERADLLEANASIFKAQAQAINEVAKKTVKVLVVGNPCNTNAYIASKFAPSIPAKNFSALLRLDQNRAISQLAEKTGKAVTTIEHVAIWGNHSPTMVADISHTQIDGKAAMEYVDEQWVENTFMPTVSKRGSAIIAARGASSAASAAAAAIDHMRDWVLGSNGRWVTMGVPSDGAYGIPEGLVFGFPVVCQGNGEYEIVKGLSITPAIQTRIDKSLQELESERQAVAKIF